MKRKFLNQPGKRAFLSLTICYLSTLIFFILGLVQINADTAAEKSIETYRTAPQCSTWNQNLQENCWYQIQAVIIAKEVIVHQGLSHAYATFVVVSSQLTPAKASEIKQEFIYNNIWRNTKVGQLVYLKYWHGKITAFFVSADIKTRAGCITYFNPQVEEHLNLVTGGALIATALVILILMPRKLGEK